MPVILKNRKSKQMTMGDNREYRRRQRGDLEMRLNDRIKLNKLKNKTTQSVEKPKRTTKPEKTHKQSEKRAN
jgi:hypothetical protein